MISHKLTTIPGFGRTGFGRDQIYPDIYIYIIQTPISWVCLRLGSTPNVGKYTTHGAIMEYHLDQRLTITDALAALALLIRSRGARHDLAVEWRRNQPKNRYFSAWKAGI